MIPLARFKPDGSLFNPSASLNITNVLPVADGWAPMPDFSAFSTALSGQCYGAIDGRQDDGTYELFAFTTTGAFKFDSSTLGWNDVTPSAGALALPNGDLWSMVQYGDYVIATNSTDGPQVYELGVSSLFSALSGSPPSAKYVNSAGDYLFLMHTASNPNLVQYSGINDITDWTIDGANGSDSQTIPDAGPIQGSARGQGGLFVLCLDQINKFTQMSEGPYAFRRDVVNPSRGCVSPASIVEAAGTFFYLDEDGFYMGPEGTPIGAEKVNRYFLERINEDFLSEVQGAVDSANKMVWWRFLKNDATYEVLGYDWQLQEWTRLDTNINYLFNVHSPGYTMEGLDNISSSLDALPYSLDSRVWKGGRPSFGGFNSSNQFGYFAGSNMAATLQTADTELGGPFGRAFVQGYRFVTDAATHTGRVSGKETHGSALSWSSATSPEATGLIPARSSARLHRFELTVPAGETWTHAHHVVPEVVEEGAV
jgi:hypothetical protein